MNKPAIIKKLRLLGAWATDLSEECYKTIALIEKEDGVSTPTKGQSALSEDQLAQISAKHRKRLFKTRT